MANPIVINLMLDFLVISLYFSLLYVWSSLIGQFTENIFVKKTYVVNYSKNGDAMLEARIGDPSLIKTNYEENDRRYNLYQLPLRAAQNHWKNGQFCQQVKKVAESVACIVSQHKLDVRLEQGRRIFRFHPAPSLNESVQNSKGASLNAKARFKNEPVIGSATAFLIGKKYALTAGHCVTVRRPDGKSVFDPHFIAQLRLVFGFCMTSSSKFKNDFDEEDVYSIQSVIAYQEGTEDWAMLELDRNVECESSERKALELCENPILANAEVYMLGYPHGLPLKVSIAATVMVDQSCVFKSNLDANHGNSGSPVVDMSHKVAGILVRGQDDFVENSKPVREYRVCREEQMAGKLETCTKVSSLAFVHASIRALVFINPFAASLESGLTLLGECSDQTCRNITKYPLGYGRFSIHEIVVTSPFLCSSCSKIILIANKTLVAMKNAQIAIEGKNADKVLLERNVICKGSCFAMSFDQWYFLNLNVRKV